MAMALNLLLFDFSEFQFTSSLDLNFTIVVSDRRQGSQTRYDQRTLSHSLV